jgi:hypothetical protein
MAFIEFAASFASEERREGQLKVSDEPDGSA